MNTFTHDLIKIKFINEGYLPNYPYHLISIQEMCDAFLPSVDDDTCFFAANYPLITDELTDEYNELKSNLFTHVSKLKSGEVSALPDWVYSYMLGSVISVNSPESDIYDLTELMGIKSCDAEISPEMCKECYRISKQWLAKVPDHKKVNRSPSMFGELHVLKYLRLLKSEVM